MFARANMIIWLINLLRLMSASAAFASKIFNKSVAIRMEITSFSGFRAINFGNTINSLLRIISEIDIISSIRI